MLQSMGSQRVGHDLGNCTGAGCIMSTQHWAQPTRTAFSSIPSSGWGTQWGFPCPSSSWHQIKCVQGSVYPCTNTFTDMHHPEETFMVRKSDLYYGRRSNLWLKNTLCMFSPQKWWGYFCYTFASISRLCLPFMWIRYRGPMVTLTKTENSPNLCKLKGENTNIYNSVMKMSLELKSLVKKNYTYKLYTRCHPSTLGDLTNLTLVIWEKP